MAALVGGLALSLHLFIREKAARQRAVAAEMEQFRLRQQAERDAEIGLKLGQAGMLLTRNQFDEAERLISDVPPHASMVPFFSVFGRIHGRRGHWQAAKANYSHAVQFLPSDHDGYHYLAPVFLQVGDVEGYQQHRQRMLRQFSDTSDPVIAERIAKDCLILPPATSDLAAISKMAKTAIAANPASGYFEFVQGFAEYRQGQWAAAADLMQQVVSKAGDRYRTGEAFMVLAMAQYQLHQMEEARATLAKGVELVETSLPSLEKNTLDEQWNDWIIVQLLMRESQALIQPGNETK